MENILREEFYRVRDIPYRIPLTSKETDFSCTGKHKQLKASLENQGLSVRWRVCTFKWSHIPLPTIVVEAPHGDDSTHAYLEAEIENEWIKVDATWDISLHNILPISEWDGKSNTRIGVPCLTTYSPEESFQIITNESPEVVDNDLAINGEFYAAFNDWLETERHR